MQYPKWLYSEEGSKLVHSAEEHEALEGYFETPWEANGTDREGNPISNDLDALKAEAESLGINVKGTWGVKKITEAIAAKKAE